MLINMNIGGTEKALLNMISEVPLDKYDITILMLEEYGGFINLIPEGVRIEYVNGYKNIKELLNNPPQLTALNFFSKGKLIKACNILFFQSISKILNDRSIFYNYLLNDQEELKSEYDIAVAYAGPMDFISYFVVKKIKAKKKIQWIHFDITKIGFNLNFAAKIYNKFDKIFVVSDEAKNKLVNMIPALKEKAEVFYNIVSTEIINTQANYGKGFNDEFDGIRILTVGRLTTEKGQDLAIRVLARLIDDGYKVKWYCIGEGNSRKKYEKLIDENNVKDKFILLGSDPNPYPFIKQCDLYVQPSRYEGYCITLIESMCLNKPIVTTDVNGVKEQIKNEETGLIVGIDENEIYNAVKKLINNNELCRVFCNNLSKEKKLDPLVEMKKLFGLF